LSTIVGKLPPLIPVVGGFGVAGVGFWLASSLTSEWGFWQFALVQACRGVGVMVAATVTQTMCVSTLRSDQVPKASGFIYLARNLGGAFGLAMLSTLLTRQTARHEMLLTAHITDIPEQLPHNPDDGTNPANYDPLLISTANYSLSGLMNVQASTLAIADLFGWLWVACWLAAAVPLVLQTATTGSRKLQP